ncbi:MAG: DUF2147 domain-containing protein [Chlamydiales bacterium]
MNKLWLVCIWVAFSLFGSDEIGGFWKSLDDNGNPQCVFGVYEHKGIYYGRIIGTYDDSGHLSDTLYKPLSKAEGVVGSPPMCGLDILYNLQDNGTSYDGRILDPTKGNVYKCELWRENENLIVRGKLFIFGKNITWYPIGQGDLPKGFKLPNMKKFVPKVPQVY